MTSLQTEQTNESFTPPEQPIEFRVTRKGTPRRRLRLVGLQYTLGNGPDCSVRLDDPSLLPIHASIERRGDRLVLRAMGRPIVVNGEARAEYHLTSGDHFVLGHYTFELVPIAPPTQDQRTSETECGQKNQRQSPRRRVSFSQSLDLLGGKPSDISSAERELVSVTEPATSTPSAQESQRAIIANEKRWQERWQRQQEKHRESQKRSKEQLEVLRTAQHAAEYRARQAEEMVQTLRQQFSELNGKFTTVARTTVPGLQQQLEQQQRENQASQTEHRQLVNALREQIEIVQTTIEEIRTETESLRQQSTFSEEQFREVAGETLQLEQSLEAFVQMQREKQAEAQAETARMRKELFETTDRLSELTNAIEESRQQRAGMNAVVESLQDALRQVQLDSRQTLALEESIALLQSQIQENEERVASLVSHYETQSLQFQEEWESLRQRLEWAEQLAIDSSRAATGLLYKPEVAGDSNREDTSADEIPQRDQIKATKLPGFQQNDLSIDDNGSPLPETSQHSAEEVSDQPYWSIDADADIPLTQPSAHSSSAETSRHHPKNDHSDWEQGNSDIQLSSEIQGIGHIIADEDAIQDPQDCSVGVSQSENNDEDNSSLSAFFTETSRDRAGLASIPEESDDLATAPYTEPDVDHHTKLDSQAVDARLTASQGEVDAFAETEPRTQPATEDSPNHHWEAIVGESGGLLSSVFLSNGSAQSDEDTPHKLDPDRITHSRGEKPANEPPHEPPKTRTAAEILAAMGISIDDDQPSEDENERMNLERENQALSKTSSPSGLTETNHPSRGSEVVLPNAQHDVSTDEDEESIEEYMNRLLNRVQGTPNPPPKSNSAITQSTGGDSPKPTDALESGSAERFPGQQPTSQIGNVHPHGSPVMHDFTGDSGEQIGDVSPAIQAIAPRRVAPEKVSNIAALRELANSNAREAIATSARRRVAKEAMFKFSIFGVGLLASLAALAGSRFSLDHWMVISVCCFLLSLFFLWESLNLRKRLLTAGQPVEAERGMTS